MSVYDKIIKGLNEAIDYENGMGKARVTAYSVAPVPDFEPIEIRELRMQLGMTQAVFAAFMGVSGKTVEAWEKGTNQPLGTARRMLGLLSADHSIPQKYHIVPQKTE